MKPLVAIEQREGELLRARDLAAGVSAETQRRAMHARMVHRTWGVALGFTLRTVEQRRALEVGPGFGYDCRGRAVVNPAWTRVPLPLAAPAQLVVSATHGLRFLWQEPGRECDDELVLAQVGVKSGRITDVDEAARRWCRARRFTAAAGIAASTLAEEIDVPTASAGFRTSPRYFATLETDAQFSGTLEVRNEHAEGFTLVLRAPAGWFDGAGGGSAANVHWIGVEELPGCGASQTEKER